MALRRMAGSFSSRAAAKTRPRSSAVRYASRILILTPGFGRRGVDLGERRDGFRIAGDAQRLDRLALELRIAGAAGHLHQDLLRLGRIALGEHEEGLFLEMRRVLPLEELSSMGTARLESEPIRPLRA